MYNGIGLQTPRGSGTNGYIQSNKFFIRPRSTGGGGGGAAAYSEQDQTGGVKKANKDILEHDRKRQIQLRLLVLQEALADQGYTDTEIEQKLGEARASLENEASALASAADGAARAIRVDNRFSETQTHQVAARKEKQLEIFRAALGINSGSEFLEPIAEENTYLENEDDLEIEEEETEKHAKSNKDFKNIGHERKRMAYDGEKETGLDSKDKKGRGKDMEGKTRLGHGSKHKVDIAREGRRNDVSDDDRNENKSREKGIGANGRSSTHRRKVHSDSENTDGSSDVKLHKRVGGAAEKTKGMREKRHMDIKKKRKHDTDESSDSYSDEKVKGSKGYSKKKRQVDTEDESSDSSVSDSVTDGSESSDSYYSSDSDSTTNSDKKLGRNGGKDSRKGGYSHFMDKKGGYSNQEAEKKRNAGDDVPASRVMEKHIEKIDAREDREDAYRISQVEGEYRDRSYKGDVSAVEGRRKHVSEDRRPNKSQDEKEEYRSRKSESKYGDRSFEDRFLNRSQDETEEYRSHKYGMAEYEHENREGGRDLIRKQMDDVMHLHGSYKGDKGREDQDKGREYHDKQKAIKREHMGDEMHHHRSYKGDEGRGHPDEHEARKRQRVGHGMDHRRSYKGDEGCDHRDKREAIRREHVDDGVRKGDEGRRHVDDGMHHYRSHKGDDRYEHLDTRETKKREHAYEDERVGDGMDHRRSYKGDEGCDHRDKRQAIRREHVDDEVRKGDEGRRRVDDGMHLHRSHKGDDTYEHLDTRETKKREHAYEDERATWNGDERGRTESKRSRYDRSPESPRKERSEHRNYDDRDADRHRRR